MLDASRALGVPVTMRGAGHLDRGQRGRPGHRRRHREAPGQRAVDRPRGAHRGRPAGRRAREPAARGRAVRPAVRARPVDPPALHDRRDDRQQRLRLPGARLRPDLGQRRGAQGRLRHRRGRGTAAARRGWRPSGWPRWASTTSAHIRTEFGRFTRQVSGYSLEHLLPERRRLDRFLVGSEGTLAVVLEATVRLVAEETGRLLVVLGYPSMAEAADAVPELLAVGWRPADRLRGPGRADRRPGEGQGVGGAGAPAGRRLAVRRGRGRGRARPGRQGRRRVGRARPPHGRRRRRAGRAVADPRGRRGPGGAQPPHPGVLRLGGRRRPARAPRRLAARLRRAAARARPRRRALRPLRRRVRARPHRLPVRARGPAWSEGLPRLPHRQRAQAARAPRLAVRRARRRPGPLGAAAADVRRGVADAVRRREGGVRPPQPAQPRQPGRPGPAGRRPPAGAAAGHRPERAPAGPRRRLPGRRRAPLHRRRQVRRAVDERRDVPVVPRHPRREGLHPRPGPGPAGGARRLAGEGPRRPRCGRGARPLPGLQGVRVRLPDRRGHGDLQGGGAAPEARRGGRTPPAQPLPARPAAPVGGPGRAGRRARERDAQAGSRRPDGPGHGRHRPAPLHPGVRAHHAAQVGADGRRRPGRLDLGRLVQRPLLPRQRARGDPLPRVGRPDRAGDPGRRVLRADLDHDRSARQGPGDHGAHGADAAALRRVRRCR